LKNGSSRGNEALIFSETPPFTLNLSLVTSAATIFQTRSQIGLSDFVIPLDTSSRLAYNHAMPEPSAHYINASTRYCAVYGHPVKHSASPAMQNAGLAALGLNWRYLAFEVPPDHLRAAIEGARSMRF